MPSDELFVVPPRAGLARPSWRDPVLVGAVLVVAGLWGYNWADPAPTALARSGNLLAPHDPGLAWAACGRALQWVGQPRPPACQSELVAPQRGPALLRPGADALADQLRVPARPPSLSLVGKSLPPAPVPLLLPGAAPRTRLRGAPSSGGAGPAAPFFDSLLLDGRRDVPYLGILAGGNSTAKPALVS